MANTVIIITDDSIDKYSIGFPVLPKDLGVWHNQLKLIENIDYTFQQSTNSIILLVPVNIDDVLQFRRFTGK